MTDSSIFHQFIKNVKCNTIYHGVAFYNLAFKYYIEEALLKNITTEAEIDDMKNSKYYLNYKAVESYFTLIEKKNYNFTELTVIISCVHDSLLVYLDTFSIFYTTIENYYGKGKIKLNRDNPEDFIKQIIETTPKFDPNTIKKQINTIQRYELVIKSIIKVIETFVVPVLPEPFRIVFNSEKDIASKQGKETSNNYSDFIGQNIDILKEKYKSANKFLYDINFFVINQLSQHISYKECFMLVYSFKFSDIKLGNVTKDLQESYKKYGDKLEQFVLSNSFPVDQICGTITLAILENGPLSKNLPIYYNNLALHKYITSK